MENRFLLRIAHLGWGLAADLCALGAMLAMIVVAGTPLLVWRFAIERAYGDFVPELPGSLILLLFVLACAMSAVLFRHTYRFLFRSH